jgi:hypothetical protein
MLYCAVLSVGLWMFPCPSALAQEYLEPEHSVFSYPDSSLEYRLTVRRRLVETEYAPALSVVCLPSFRSEWVISLLEDRGTFSVVLSEARKPLYGKERPQDVPIDRKRVPLDPPLAKILCDLWRDALLHVRYLAPRADGIIEVTADGERYHFEANQAPYGTLAGQTHSPRKGTLPASLVAIADSLREYAKADGKARSRITRVIEAEAASARRRLQATH